MKDRFVIDGSKLEFVIDGRGKDRCEKPTNFINNYWEGKIQFT